MKPKRTIGIFAAVFYFGSCLTQVSAGIIEYSAAGNYLLTTAYNSTASIAATRLSLGSTVEVGTFTAGFNFATNSTSYTANDAAFTLINTTTIGTGINAVGQFDKQTGNIDGIAAPGTQLYIWVFNNPVPASATAWAIVTNPTWTVPATGGTGLSTIDTGDPGTIIAVGALGAIVGDTAAIPLGATFSVRVSAVPEPSTYAMSFAGCVSLLLLAKRRQSSVNT